VYKYTKSRKNQILKRALKAQKKTIAVSKTMNLVLELLSDAGFPQEMYLVYQRDTEVVVEIDDLEGAEYLMKVASEEKYRSSMMTQRTRNGKRQKLVFYPW